MTAMARWLVTLGTSRAASNAAEVLDARRRAEAGVDALADRLIEKVQPAA